MGPARRYPRATRDQAVRRRRREQRGERDVGESRQGALVDHLFRAVAPPSSRASTTGQWRRQRRDHRTVRRSSDGVDAGLANWKRRHNSQQPSRRGSLQPSRQPAWAAAARLCAPSHRAMSHAPSILSYPIERRVSPVANYRNPGRGRLTILKAFSTVHAG